MNAYDGYLRITTNGYRFRVEQKSVRWRWYLFGKKREVWEELQHINAHGIVPAFTALEFDSREEAEKFCADRWARMCQDWKPVENKATP